MHLKATCVSAWLLATAGLSQGRALGSHDGQNGAVLPRTYNTTSTSNETMLGEGRYDQVLFFECSNGRDKYGRVIAYYDHPPQWPDKPTQMAFKEMGGSWGKGCDGKGKSTDGAEWACDIDPYVFDEMKNQSWVGSMTYGFTGYNCFMDTGHPVYFEGGDYGTCYAELYCTHDRATTLQVDSSKETVRVLSRSTVIDGKKEPTLPAGDAHALVRHHLNEARLRIHGQQCNPSLVKLSDDCSMSVSCKAGEDSYLETLADALIAIYDAGNSTNDMFKLIEQKDCTPQSPICDPFTQKCKEQPDICDYTKGVEMPAKYVLSLADRAPPRNGDKSHPMGDLTVEIQCVTRKNDVMCDAMSKLVWSMGLYGTLSGLFSVGSLGIKAGCM